jgi:signal transduction histidine kinase/CheY-like chemotaxis protein
MMEGLKNIVGSTSPDESVSEETYRICNKWGDYISVRSRGIALRNDAEGRPLEILVVTRDLNEQKSYESALIQAKELESLGVLSRGVIHDLNNILMGIQGNAELASDNLLDPSALHSALREMTHGTVRASQLCRQLLSYSGHGRVQLTQLQLNDQIRDALSQLKDLAPDTARLQVELEDDLPMVQADSIQIKYALLNMMANALDSLGDLGGDITISTSLKHLGIAQGYAPGGLDGDFVCLEVKDTGQGMSEETLHSIFTPTYEGRFPDRGLGMLLIQWIAREHKGAVDLRSSSGEGSVVRLFFPLTQREGSGDLSDVGSPVSSGQGVILVVEDEPTIRMVLRKGLEQVGYQVIESVDGVDGFGAFVRHRSVISAVLLDLTMPRMNGDQVFEEIHKLAPEVPVILMSGYSQKEATSAIAGKGLAGFLSKPCSVKEVQSIVSRVIAGNAV